MAPGRPARGNVPVKSCIRDPVAMKVMKDEGLIFSILKCISLKEARRLWNLSKLFFKVLDGKVVPLLALLTRDWGLVSHYMSFPADACFGDHPRFEYNYDSICVEVILHQDFEGLKLLSQRRYDFESVRRDPRLRHFAREALQQGRVEHLFLLRAVLFDYSEVLAEAAAKGELSEQFFIDRCIVVDFLGTRLHYRCSVLDFASTDYVERQLAALCGSREALFKVPFMVAAFIRAGASPCCFMRADGCGYLLLLALASESFNFVYLLVKEAIHLEAVFEHYQPYILLMVQKALEHNRPYVLDLMHFCGFRLKAEEASQQCFDEVLLRCLLSEDFQPLERMCRLGFSMRGFAERNQVEFQNFVQSRLEDRGEEPPADRRTASSPSSAAAAGRGKAHAAIRRLASLDRWALELHFRSQRFLDFTEALMVRKSFVVLRQIVELHPYAFDAYFMEHYAMLEASLLDAFLLRDISLIVDLTSLSFPMAPFFLRQQAEVDAVVLNTWLANKCWTDLGMLKSSVRQWSFPAFFERSRERSDEFVEGIVRNGYWFDLHKLAQLSFDFEAFFDRRFGTVSRAVLNFIVTPHPHFVLLRELSALNFPWARFMQAHHHEITPSKDHDFLQFVMSLEGFELGSKVYDVVEQTCRLYHSMAANMFKPVPGCRRPEPVASPPPPCAEIAEEAEGPAEAGEAEAEAPCTPSQPEGTSASSSASSCPAPALAAAGGSANLDEGAADGGSAGGAVLGERIASTPRRRRPASVEASPMASPGSVECEGLAAASPQRPLEADEAVEAARLLRQRAEDLARKAREKKLDAKKVLMLMICKGAYCWNPLKAAVEDVASDSKDPNMWADVEGALGFLESRDGPAVPQGGSLLNQMLPPGHLVNNPHAAVVPVPAGPGAAGAVNVTLAGNAVTVHPLGLPVPAVANHPAGLNLPPPVQFALRGVQGPGSQQLVFHIVCLAQRGEQNTFVPRVELFWADILEKVLPLRSAG